MFAYLLAYWLVRILVRQAIVLFQDSAAKKGGPHMITLNLRPVAIVARKTLCSTCVYSHIVRGYELQEEIIFCGYAFPLRAVPFLVRECTDFRAKRGAQVARAETAC
jgi:hypothetical protein